MRGTILVVLCFALLPSCVGDKRSLERKRRVLSKVNGIPIHAEEFRREFNRIRLGDDEGQPSVVGEQAQKRALLDDLIERRLVLEEADRLNVLIGIDEVEAAYQRMRAGWKQDELDQLLEKKDTTPAELKAEMRELLLIKKFFREHVFARVAVTDEEIAKYLEGHPEVQILPEEVHALQIVVKTEEKAKEVHTLIRRGLAFEDAAVKYSLSPEAKSGGDLGFFARGMMPSIFDEVCFNLRPGEVSKVVASDYGHHLFKVIEKREERLTPVDQVRNEVEKVLRREKEREAQAKKVAELRGAAKVVINEKELARIY